MDDGVLYKNHGKRTQIHPTNSESQPETERLRRILGAFAVPGQPRFFASAPDSGN